MTLCAEHRIDSGKKIVVYDDLFSRRFRETMFSFAANSMFSIGWPDGATEQTRTNSFLHSKFSYEDVISCGILDAISNSNAAHELNGLNLKECILNLSTPSDSHYPHTHQEGIIFLYYVNTEWFDGWHGETLFFDESLKTIAYANAYTPGRLVVFDATIPHAIRPQSHIANKYRFTLALTFIKKENL
jgi:hypothetical protein